MNNILLVEDDEVDIMNFKLAFKQIKVTNPLFVAANQIELLAIRIHRKKFCKVTLNFARFEYA
ncbi:hypothetical protein [Brasilonema octagenarum]|uniref:Response regulator n=1 Tax=Brasilonema octagenarum UFV-OR1 TaxID=417115 RepID=A0ABX1MG76_9CYAN|nr:hypothetical protein [Brasilonema octagenarum]NMF66041.1 hypothetical protein [Brasilonema octagenarum UFV-OR1]